MYLSERQNNFIQNSFNMYWNLPSKVLFSVITADENEPEISHWSSRLIKATGKKKSGDFNTYNQRESLRSCCSIYLITDQFNHWMICVGERRETLTHTHTYTKQATMQGAGLTLKEDLGIKPPTLQSIDNPLKLLNHPWSKEKTFELTLTWV